MLFVVSMLFGALGAPVSTAQPAGTPRDRVRLALMQQTVWTLPHGWCSLVVEIGPDAGGMSQTCNA